MAVCFIMNSGDPQVVDARGGPSLKMTVKSKKVKPLSRRIRPSQICRVQNELKRNSECLLIVKSGLQLNDRTM